MEPALWHRIEELLQAALDHEPHERAAFLERAAGADIALRREVESLLAHEQRGAAAALSVFPVAGLAASATLGAPSLSGQTLGRYRVAGRIGAGGMGEVYEASDERLGRTVALKVLPEELWHDEERRQRFEREALTISKLNHPNIITIFEVTEWGSVRLLVTEHVEGQTLRELLTDPETGEPRALPLERTLDIGAQVAAALVAAHTAWIIHRDIKPENVMVRADGLVKVLDFGIARLGSSTPSFEVAARAFVPAGPGESAPNLTVAGAVLGTRGYMSPEQTRGEALDGRSDLYSLGLVLFEMATGERFGAGTEEVVAAGASRFGRLPGELRAIVQKLLEVDPARRYASAGDLAGDLARAVARASGRSARRLAGAGALALLVAVAIATVAALLSVDVRWEERVLRDGHTAAARRAVFSPDGRLLVSVGEDGQTIVWDFDRRQRLHAHHGPPVQQVAFSPAGRWFVTGGSDGSLVVFDAELGVATRTLGGHRDAIGALGFSPDGEILVASSSGQAGLATSWNTAGWTKEREWSALTSWGAVVFWPELRQLVVGTHLLSLASASARESPWSSANWLAVAPDGTRSATVDSRGIVAFYRFGDPHGPTRPELVASRRAHQDHGRAIVFSPDGSLVASGSESVVLWDATTHEVIARFEHSAVVWSLAFHPEGRWLVSSHADGALLVWDVTERELVASFNEHARSVRAVAFSRDGRTVASGGEDRAVLVWDVRTGGRLAFLAGHETRVTGVAFLPDGGLVSTDQDGVIIVWDLERERPRSVLQPPPKADPSYSLAVSPDGTQLANTNGLLRLGAREPVVAFHAGPIRSFGATYGLAFSPDGRRLAAVTDGGWLLIFETVQGRLLERRKVEETPVVAVTFSPDGRWLATGGDEGTLRLWSVSPLEDVAVLGRHEARIKSVAFSPEGDVVASAGDDRRIVLWEVASRRLRSTIGTHASPIYAIAFTPDGEQLVSGEHDSTVRVYTRERSLWGVRLE